MKVVPGCRATRLCQPLEDVQEGREGRAGEGPVGVVAQFLPALVVFIDRVKESHRVSHVDHDRQVQLARRLPDGIQARVVDLDKPVVMVFYGKPKAFPNLQALGAAFLLQPEPARCPAGKIIPLCLPLAPIHAAEDQEALRGGLLEVLQVRLQDGFAPAAVQVHVAGDARLVEQVEQFCQRALVPAAAEILAQVVVGVDGGEARFFHQCGAGDELGLGGEVL